MEIRTKSNERSVLTIDLQHILGIPGKRHDEKCNLDTHALPTFS